MGAATFIGPGPVPGDLLGRFSGEQGDESGSRGGVADAHFTGDEGVGSLVDGVQTGLDAHLEGSDGIIEAHGRPDGDVVGAVLDLAIHDSGSGRKVLEYADVGDDDLATHLTGEHPHAGSPGSHVDGLLVGDLLRVGRDTLGTHTVIAGEQADDGMVGDRPRNLSVNRAQLLGEGFQQPEGSLRLGEYLLTLVGLVPDPRIHRGDGPGGTSEQALGRQ